MADTKAAGAYSLSITMESKHCALADFSERDSSRLERRPIGEVGVDYTSKGTPPFLYRICLNDSLSS